MATTATVTGCAGWRPASRQWPEMGALPVMVEDAQDLRGTVMRPEGVTVAAGRSFAIDLTPPLPPANGRYARASLTVSGPVLTAC